MDILVNVLLLMQISIFGTDGLPLTSLSILCHHIKPGSVVRGSTDEMWEIFTESKVGLCSC